ncbi:hypothetical protein [Brevibacillus migulae]|uniref:hypothetical protein n=1 Tax=Brevibacillus migulae TaxID=1644114 RepID=UPI00106DEBB9|nr:hypothetical protein [Brevibacillus migulae]
MADHKFYDPLTPVVFDKNEWAVIVIFFLTEGTATYLHTKHRVMRTAEGLALILFNVYFTSLLEFILATKPVDLYDTIDRNYGELFDLPLEMVTYPVTMYIFMHVFLAWSLKKRHIVLLGAALLLILEWITMHFFSLFTYKGWNLMYSYFFYMFVLTINVNLTEWLHKRVVTGHE